MYYYCDNKIWSNPDNATKSAGIYVVYVYYTNVYYNFYYYMFVQKYNAHFLHINDLLQGST